MKKIHAFTLSEILIVLVMMGIIATAMMVYLSDPEEKTIMYKAEWCLNTINGELQNSLMIALTSKGYKDETISIFPDYYTISLSETWFELYGKEANGSGYLMKEINKSECKTSFEQPFIFVKEGFSTLEMTRGYAKISPKDTFTFILKNNDDILFTGEVLVKLDLWEERKKEFAKFLIDARNQSITMKKCIFYKVENENECEEWEQ